MVAKSKGTAFLFVFLAALSVIPTLVLCEDTDARINALVEQVALLEARVGALEAQIGLLAPEEEAADELQDVFSPDEALALDNSLTVTVLGYEASESFRYYPAGGFFSSTVSAKKGFLLVCVFMRVENRSGADISASLLLDAELLHGADGVSRATNSFFHLTQQGVYAGGLKYFPSKTAVEGCLLFALPESSATSGGSLALRITQDGASYKCLLRSGNAATGAQDMP